MSELTRPSFEERLEALLGWLCVEWGFCLPPDVQDEISKARSISADAFASAVLTGEGMNAEYELEWRRRIRARFVEYFGTDSVSAPD